MSGCMNACGHHHVGHIGILGVDKHGEEWYQITLGGSASGVSAARRGDRSVGAEARGGRHASSASSRSTAACAHEEERFIDTVRRVGVRPFKERAYAALSCGSVSSSPIRGATWARKSPPAMPLIVPLTDCKKSREHWWQWSGTLGVRLSPGRPGRRASSRSCRSWI